MRRRALVLATLIVVLSSVASGQEPRVLHIKVTLTDAARASVPVARHPLLISDNPATSTPRRVVTAADGTADVRLRPGNYTVESDEPFAFNGKGYQWTQTLDVPAGRDVVLELTSKNAEIVAAPVPASSSSAAPIENDSSLLRPQWQESVVSIWTPESRASGFLVDAAGLVVTDQRSIGGASAVEVQLTPSVKVGARVLAADRARDVAVLWIDPTTAAAVRPVPLNCADGAKPPVVDRDRLVALGAPLHGPKELFLGNAGNFRLEPDSTGGPVFSSGGSIVGISSVVDEQDDSRRREARVVAVADVCAVVASAEKAMQTAPRPVATRLPVEPVRSVSASEGLSAALDAAVQRRTGNLNAYQMSSADFDIAFLTPVMVYAAQHKASQATQQTSQQTTLGSQGRGHRLRQVVGLFLGCSAGSRGARHAQADGKFLDDGCEGSGVYAGRGHTGDQTFQAGVFAAARLVWRHRGDADPPVHARAACVGDRRRSRRPLRLRPAIARAALRVRQAHSVVRERSE